MARYIDADKIVFWIRHVSSNGMLCDTDVRKVAFSDEIARMPTADVAPRAEVEKWFRECEELQGRMIEVEKEIRKEIATEIFEEIEKLAMYGTTSLGLCLMSVGVASFTKLKKKYTEN